MTRDEAKRIKICEDTERSYGNEMKSVLERKLFEQYSAQ